MVSFRSAAVPIVAIMWQFLSLGLAADQPTYQSCPLLRAYYPPPTINKSSDAIKLFAGKLTSVFDDLVRTGKSDDFGTITPNTTSFSVVLFSGADDGTGEPIFYEYHHTAPAAGADGNVTSATVFPVGTLTQLFTVYTWLVELGDQYWGEPVTSFLPELGTSCASTDGLTVNWSDITIGALAGHMAGIARDSHVCELGSPCNRETFMNTFSRVPPLFLPDTTPIISNAAFQLLSFALTNTTARHGSENDFGDIAHKAVFQPLNMTKSSFLDTNGTQVFGEGLNISAPGEQAALSMLSTTGDLARLGHAMLSSRLVTPAITRRWLQPIADTSNLRNGVGRPWEIYHAATASSSDGTPAAAAPILDVFLKAGQVAQYSSYLGLSPDVGAGFAILAHDTSGAAADLNVYSDVVSQGVGELLGLAASEAAERYAGVYGSIGSRHNVAVFNVSDDGPGLVVTQLLVDGTDLRVKTATAAGILLENLDFRVYPTNVVKRGLHQFVAVFQDRSAPVDMGTPTCITWMTVDSLGPTLVDRFVFEVDPFVFEVDPKGMATQVLISGKGTSLTRSK